MFLSLGFKGLGFGVYLGVRLGVKPLAVACKENLK